MGCQPTVQQSPAGDHCVPGVQVDVGPAQRADLTATGTGSRRESHQRPKHEALRGRVLDEALHNIGCWWREWSIRAAWSGGQRDRVRHHPAGTHRVGHRPVQHVMGALDRRRRQRLAAAPTGSEQLGVERVITSGVSFDKAIVPMRRSTWVSNTTRVVATVLGLHVPRTRSNHASNAAPTVSPVGESGS
jgi:hypothetical protein